MSKRNSTVDIPDNVLDCIHEIAPYAEKKRNLIDVAYWFNEDTNVDCNSEFLKQLRRFLLVPENMQKFCNTLVTTDYVIKMLDALENFFGSMSGQICQMECLHHHFEQYMTYEEVSEETLKSFQKKVAIHRATKQAEKEFESLTLQSK